jgi:hypothetical protein
LTASTELLLPTRHFPAQHYSFYLLQHNYSRFKTLLPALIAFPAKPMICSFSMRRRDPAAQVERAFRAKASRITF